MPDGPDVAVFILLALPGFIALGLYTTLTPTKPHEASNQIVLVVVLSMLSYLFLASTHLVFAWMPDPGALLAATSAQALSDGKESLKPGLNTVFTQPVLLAVAAASGIATLLGLILVHISCREWLHRCARAMKLSKKYGYTSHWDVIVHTVAKKRWLSIIFEDKTEYIGALESYSDASDERSLLLGSVAKYKEDGKRDVWGEGDFLFVPDLKGVRSIRLTGVPAKPKAKRRKEPKHGEARKWTWLWWRKPAGSTGTAVADTPRA